MSSFIYFYSKFTEEFLLLGGAAIFTLLAAYCYYWVVKRRRLGAARSQVPSTVVKAYLNQLINEAQFVRTQLFGLLGGEVDPQKASAMFMRPQFEVSAAGTSGAAFQAQSMPTSSAPSGESTGGVPADLMERLKALEGQLAQKEALVVNINVEKTKLLEEVENLKQNQKALQNSSNLSAGQDELLKKIRNLEERLEEYSLFEDDLANLKRLQQENSALKKRLEENGGAPAPQAAASVAAAPSPAAEPAVPLPGAPLPNLDADPSPAVAADSKKAGVALDQNTIDSLLDGVSPIDPQAQTAAAPREPEVPAPGSQQPAVEPTPIRPNAAQPAIQASPAAENLVVDPKGGTQEPKVSGSLMGEQADNFEKLVDSVETSLSKTPAAETPAVQAAPKAAAAAPATPEAAKAAPAPAAGPAISEKSDEELLKEFENLLNS